MALECLERRLALSLSHTVAPFAHLTQTFVAASVAPYNRHAEAAVQSGVETQPVGQASGKRQHIPLLTQDGASPQKTVSHWIQGMPGETVVARTALQETPSIINRHPTLSDVDRRSITVT